MNKVEGKIHKLLEKIKGSFLKQDRIRETKHLSTDADSSTDTKYPANDLLILGV